MDQAFQMSLQAPRRVQYGASCDKCDAEKHCGGFERDKPILRSFGCVPDCRGCAERGCDYTCPNNLPLFRKRLADVEGLDDFTIPPVIIPSFNALPKYLPLIYRGSSRLAAFEEDIVAIPLFRVVKAHGLAFETADQLRDYFKVRRDSRVILVGVDIDRRLEWFWKTHRSAELGAKLQRLNISAITIPNFSFFTDSPGWHILYNRKRLLLAQSRLSMAGVPTIPHVNANSSAHWSFWEDFLREHSEVTMITKEFQTGNRLKNTGDATFEALCDLQSKINRPLHPILVGGGRHFKRAQEHFDAFTVVDGQPYLQTVSRRKLGGQALGYKWKKNPTPRGACINSLFTENVSAYREKLSADNSDILVNNEFAEENGSFFAFMTSIPVLKHQPVAPAIS